MPVDDFEARVRAKGGGCERCDSIVILVVDRQRLGRLGVFTTWSCTECGHRWEVPGRHPNPNAVALRDSLAKENNDG